jgi:hypothetical protein
MALRLVDDAGFLSNFHPRIDSTKFSDTALVRLSAGGVIVAGSCGNVGRSTR